MTLEMTFIPVRKIKPSVSRWNFSDEVVEQAARLVAKVEGLINPILLRREADSESYEVLDGNFEYYVAAKACELKPRSCETIAAFIIEPEDEGIIQEQIELFRKRAIGSQTDDAALLLPDSLTDPEQRLRYLEARQSQLEARQAQLETQTIKPLEQQVQTLSDQLHHKAKLLEELNELDHAELLSRLKRVGLTGKNAEKIIETIEYERHYNRFESLKDVVMRVKGLTYEKMVDLIENS